MALLGHMVVCLLTTAGLLTRTTQSLKANMPDYAVGTLVRIKPTVMGWELTPALPEDWTVRT